MTKILIYLTFFGGDNIIIMYMLYDKEGCFRERKLLLNGFVSS